MSSTLGVDFPARKVKPKRGDRPEAWCPTRKRAIFNETDQKKVLEAADPETERVAVWLMMMVGMHPTNLIRLKPSNLDHDSQGWWLQYKRVKNDRPRRELLEDAIGEALALYLRRTDRLRSRQGVFLMVRRVGLKSGLGSLTPMNLRHTACVRFLRQYAGGPAPLDLVAAKMGCTVAVVKQNYIDLEDWERIR